jgi:hypothetical protein
LGSEENVHPYTVKKGYQVSRPLAGISLTKLSLAGNNLIIWLVTSWLETGKSLPFYYSVFIVNAAGSVSSSSAPSQAPVLA